LATATPLTYLPGGNLASHAYSYYGTIENPTATHFYQFVAPTTPNNATQAMLVSVNALKGGINDPGIHVYDQAGNQQPFQVLTNDGQTYTVQLTGIAPNATYYVQLTSQCPNGSHAGDYFLSIDFGAQPSSVAPAVGRSTLSQTNPVDTATLTVAQAALFHFALSADEGVSTVPVSVTMTITDADNQVVFSLTVQAGQPAVTLNQYLGAGTYHVKYQLALAEGAAPGTLLPAVVYELDAGVFSEPQGPYYTGGTSGTGFVYVGATTSGSQPHYY
jgi:methionine-rich copper-binding protein CopC